MNGTTGEVPAEPATKSINQLITMTFAPEHEDAFLEMADLRGGSVRANEPDTLVYMRRRM